MNLCLLSEVAEKRLSGMTVASKGQDIYFYSPERLDHLGGRIGTRTEVPSTLELTALAAEYYADCAADAFEAYWQRISTGELPESVLPVDVAISIPMK